MSSADYLRAAHAYMLISMPTGTSTIFGAFQAILALLAYRTTSALSVKLPCKEKFASEIFCYKPPRVILLQRDNVNRKFFRFGDQTKMGSRGSSLPIKSNFADCHPEVCRERRIKNL
jgi:hypothetical protein